MRGCIIRYFPGARLRPEIHSVDGPTRIWVNAQALVGIASQIAGSLCKFWLSPVNFTFPFRGIGNAQTAAPVPRVITFAQLGGPTLGALTARLA